jgi:hypothetical protein
MNNVNEKTIIRSERYKIKRAIIIIILLGIIALIYLASSYYIEGSDKYDSYRETYNEHQYQGYCEKTYWAWIDDYIVSKYCYICQRFDKFDNSNFDYATTYMFENLAFLYWLVIPLVSTALIVFVVWALTQSFELTVTDKRVYGKLLFGIRVDIPIDSISSTSGANFLSAVSVKSSSGKISFLFVKNNTMVQEKINELIMRRNEVKSEQVVAAQTSIDDEMVKIEKYKNLLDQGIITQEEFDAKKKQLLGL